VTRDQIRAELEQLRVGTGDVVYLARRGEDYWYAPPGTTPHPALSAEAWLWYSGRWPQPGDDFRAFFEDLLSEMESMAGGADRCRWPLDAPWPHSH
jgi:hypothetical protein